MPAKPACTLFFLCGFSGIAAGCIGGLISIKEVRREFNDIGNVTGEYIAYIIERGRGDITVMLKRIKRTLTEGVIFYQRIGADAFFLHRFPERFI